MGIGKRIKEARERKGYTQNELGALVGVTGSAITNYENEISHPREQILYSLIRVLNVDANFLFQDCVESSTEKAPAPDESEARAAASRLYSALISAGVVAPGEDLTAEQIEALDAIHTLITVLLKPKG